MGLSHFYQHSSGVGEYTERNIYFTKINRDNLSKSKKIKKDLNSIDESLDDLKQKDDDNDKEELLKTNINFSTQSFSSTIDETKKSNYFNELMGTMSKINPPDRIRKSYYQRLIHKNIITLSKESIKNNTLFIYDWDDTLFFTTHLNPSQNNIFFHMNANEKRIVDTIEYYIIELLNKSLSKGTVLIISNSNEGWIHKCAKHYYPNLIPILKDVFIISSRDLYQDKYPNDPVTWKVKTFTDLKKKFDLEKSVTNIICMGDDKCEIIAAKKLGENLSNCLVKTIKFRESPNFKDLIKQLILINEQIIRIYNFQKSLNIKVEKIKNPFLRN